MSTRELLELLDRYPGDATGQTDKRIPLLAKLGLIRLYDITGMEPGYLLTADGRDLLHGASERRRSA